MKSRTLIIWRWQIRTTLRHHHRLLRVVITTVLSLLFSFGALCAASTCENEIDYDAVRERLVWKIETARINYEPFAHVFMENIFPDEVYDCILEHLPTRLGSYRPMEKNRKRHFIPLIDRLGGVQTKVPFWSELSKVTLGSDDVRDAYVRKFRTTIESRFKMNVEKVLKTVQLNHRLDLTRDSPGYSIPPHTDTNDKAVTILYYLAQKGGKSKMSMGTKTYVSKKNESDAWKDGIASAANNFNGFTEIESAPFVPNVVFAFAPCWSSWHGVKNIGNSERDTIQGFITIEQLANKKELKEYLRTTRRVSSSSGKKKNRFFENFGRKVACIANPAATFVGMDDSPPRISSEAEEVLRQMNSLTKQSDSFGKLPLH